MNTTRMNSRSRFLSGMVFGWATVLSLFVILPAAFAQSPNNPPPPPPLPNSQQNAQLKPGDKVTLPSGQRGTVISVVGGNVSVLLTVQANQLVKSGAAPNQTNPPMNTNPPPNQTNPPPMNTNPPPNQTNPPPMNTNPPPNQTNPPNNPGPADPQSALVGTWISSDRALVVQNRKQFRIFWTDERGSVRVDDGTYKFTTNFQGERVIDFVSKRGEKWPWKLIGIDQKSVVMSHASVGTRKFARVSRKDKHRLVGTWHASYTTNQGGRGRAQVYFYQDGMYVIDEYDRFNKFDHRMYGTWDTNGERKSLSITSPAQGQLSTVSGSLTATDNDHFDWKFTSLSRVEYTYRCHRETP